MAGITAGWSAGPCPPVLQWLFSVQSLKVQVVPKKVYSVCLGDRGSCSRRLTPIGGQVRIGRDQTDPFLALLSDET